MVNRVILVGNLTRDAECLPTARGTLIRMRLATSTQWKDSNGDRQESTEFHSLIAFGRLAEICGQYCLKGRRIYVEGRLRTRDYEGSDGLRRTTTEIVLDTMRLLDRREHEGGGDLLPPGGSVNPIPAGSGFGSAEAGDSGRDAREGDAALGAEEADRVPALSGSAAG